MKSRLAILGMLVTGMLLSTTGAGLAIDGFTGGNDASVAQYGTVTPTPTPGGEEKPGKEVLGESESSSGGGKPAGEQAESLQPTRQVEVGAGGDQLPFTGFLAIPVLLAGVALLSTGIVLRRRGAGDAS